MNSMLRLTTLIIFGKIHFLLISENEFFHKIRHAGITSLHGIQVLLIYHLANLTTIINYRPENPPILGAWKGIRDDGKTGLFDAKEVQPYIQIKTVNPRLRSIKVNRSSKYLFLLCQFLVIVLFILFFSAEVGPQWPGSPRFNNISI